MWLLVPFDGEELGATPEDGVAVPLTDVALIEGETGKVEFGNLRVLESEDGAIWVDELSRGCEEPAEEGLTGELEE